MLRCLIGSERNSLVEACSSTGRPFGLVDYSLPSIGLQPGDAAQVLSRSTPLLFENAQNPVSIEVIGITDMSLGSAMTVLAMAGELPTDPQTQRLLGLLSEVENRGRHTLNRVVVDHDIRNKILTLWSCEKSINANLEYGDYKQRDCRHVADAGQGVESYKIALIQTAAGDQQFLIHGPQQEEDMRQVNEHSFVSFQYGLITRVYWNREPVIMYATPDQGGREARGVVMLRTMPRPDGNISLAFRKPIKDINAVGHLAWLLGRSDCKGDELFAEAPARGNMMDDLYMVIRGTARMFYENHD